MGTAMATVGKDEEQERYERLQTRQGEQWEASCRNCGACCGAVDGDPCRHLVSLANGRYACAIYPRRFGLRETRQGRVFRCVPIRNIVHKSWPWDTACGYKQRRPSHCVPASPSPWVHGP